MIDITSFEFMFVTSKMNLFELAFNVYFFILLLKFSIELKIQI